MEFPYAVHRGQIYVFEVYVYVSHIFTFIYIEKHGYNEPKVKTTLYLFVCAVCRNQAAADSRILYVYYYNIIRMVLCAL